MADLYTVGIGATSYDMRDASAVKQAELCTVEVSPATAAHAVGDYLCYNGLLYRVTATIAAGDTLTVGTNIALTTVGAVLSALGADKLNSYGKGVNLLDNWYFGNPDAIIDQRGGYVVPPGKPIYIPDGGGQVGTTDKYYTVTSINSEGYPFFTVDGEVRTSDPNTAVRGYAGDGYTIDRWKGRTGSLVLLLNDCIRIYKTTGINGHCGLNQGFPFESIAGKKLTFSVLVKSCVTDSNSYPKIGVYFANSVHAHSVNVATKRIPNGGSGLYSVTTEIPAESDYSFVNFTLGYFSNESVGSIDVIAAKLELGDTQTLAHQDANGNWVLNDPPPNYQQELAKCQRYFTRFTIGLLSTVLFVAGKRYINFGVPIPVTMREKPALTIVGNIQIAQLLDGTIVYNTQESGIASHTIYRSQDSQVQVNMKLNSDLPLTEVYRVYLQTGYMDLSADL